MTRKLFTLFIANEGRLAGFRYRGLFPKHDRSIPLGQDELFIVEENELQDFQRTISDNDSPHSYFLFEVGGSGTRPNGRLSLTWLGQHDHPQLASQASATHFRFNSHYFARVLNVPQARRLFYKSENLFVPAGFESLLVH